MAPTQEKTLNDKTSRISILGIDDFAQVISPIEIRNNCTITLMQSGALVIKTKLIRDAKKRSFYNPQIFFSESQRKYLITANYKTLFYEIDIKDFIKNASTKKAAMTIKDAIACLNLDQNDFDLLPSGEYRIKPDVKNYFSLREFSMTWLCLDYTIIA